MPDFTGKVPNLHNLVSLSARLSSRVIVSDPQVQSLVMLIPNSFVGLFFKVHYRYKGITFLSIVFQTRRLPWLLKPISDPSH